MEARSQYLKKINITILITWEIFGKIGGTQKVLSSFTNAMIERGYSVNILCPDKVEGAPFYTIVDAANIIRYGSVRNIYTIKIVRKLRTFFYRKLKRKYKRRLLEIEGLVSQVKEKLAECNTDIYIAFSPYAAYILRKAIGYNCSIPMITMVHSVITSVFCEMFSKLEGIGIKESEHKLNEFEKILWRDFKDCVRSSTKIQVLMPEFIKEAEVFFECRNVICIPNAVPQFSIDPNLSNKRIINVAHFPSLVAQSSRRILESPMAQAIGLF